MFNINDNDRLRLDVQNAIFEFEENIENLRYKISRLQNDIDKLLEFKKNMSENNEWTDFCEKALQDCLIESSVLNVELLLSETDLAEYQERFDKMR